MKLNYTVLILPYLSYFTLGLSTPSCKKIIFLENERKKNENAAVLKAIPSVTKEACQRACQLTSKCYHYNMLWTSGNNSGTCQLLAPGAVTMVDNDQATYYIACPGSMLYEPSMMACYVVPTVKKTYAEAANYCENIHPNAHLVDILSEEENSLVSLMVESVHPQEKSYYTSGQNTNDTIIPGPQQISNFKWMNSGQDLTIYSNFISSQPDAASIDDKCVRPVKIWAWQWKDAICTRIHPFVCKLA